MLIKIYLRFLFFINFSFIIFAQNCIDKCTFVSIAGTNYTIDSCLNGCTQDIKSKCLSSCYRNCDEEDEKCMNVCDTNNTKTQFCTTPTDWCKCFWNCSDINSTCRNKCRENC
jgi:uncharacterized membrane-anchored protein YitT (DUF2179 family)